MDRDSACSDEAVQGLDQAIVIFEPGRVGILHHKPGGSVVTGVEAEGQAERAGVKVGWQILAVSDQPCTGFHDKVLQDAKHGSSSYQVTFKKVTDQKRDTLEIEAENSFEIEEMEVDTSAAEAEAKAAEDRLENARVERQATNADSEKLSPGVKQPSPSSATLLVHKKSVCQEAEAKTADDRLENARVERQATNADGEKLSPGAKQPSSSSATPPVRKKSVCQSCAKEDAEHSEQPLVHSMVGGAYNGYSDSSLEGSFVTMKVTFENCFYRISVPTTAGTPKYIDVMAAIQNAFGKDLTKFKATYVDEDGDACILNRSTFHDFLTSSSSDSRKVWRFTLAKLHGVEGPEHFNIGGGELANDSLIDNFGHAFSDDEEVGIAELVQSTSIDAENDPEFVLLDAEPAMDRCFLKSRTVLRSPDGSCKLVSSLQQGDLVLGNSGKQLRVVFLREHPKKLCNLTTVRTPVAELTVTSDHRIMVSSQGTSCEKLADELKPGDTVFCGQRPQKVTKVLNFQQRVELMEVRFTPDEPVEALMVSHYGILTKGDRNPLLAQLELPVEGVTERHTFIHVDEPGRSRATRRAHSAER